MPRGVPTINSRAEELIDAPAPEVIGTIKPTTDPDSSLNRVGGVSFDPDETPPPWEVDPKYGRHTTDARRFVEVPENWELRWINPRMIDQYGWRDWQPVMASDPRVHVIVRQLIDPGNNIRRGGPGGDVLAWMYRSWVESRKAQKADLVARQTRRAVERSQRVREEINRGSFGPNLRVESVTHPTHTMGEGKSMETD